MATIPGVSDGELIRTTWGDAVADELNIRCIKRDGTVAMTAQLTLDNVNPVLDDHAVRKKYADDTFFNKAGGTITGVVVINPDDTSQVLVLRSQLTGGGGAYVDAPYIRFQNHSATSLGYLQATVSSMNLVCDTGNVNITAGGSGDIVLNSGGGQVRCTDALYTSGGTPRFFATTVQQISTAGSTHYDFYPNGTSVDSIGTRAGFVGYTGDGHLHVENEGNTTSLFLSTGNAIVFETGATPVEVARIDAGTLLIGKNVANIATEGLELLGGTGQIYSTFTGGVITDPASIRCNRLGSVDGEMFIDFLRNTSTRIGRIEQVGTTGVTLLSGSDHRMKTVVGPITDAVERVKALKPYRVTWNGDPGRGETDAFIAHEVQPIVPEAVSGVKDAVAGPPVNEGDPPEGTPVMQAMAYDKLMTVTIAALQDALAQIETLSARVAALEAA